MRLALCRLDSPHVHSSVAAPSRISLAVKFYLITSVQAFERDAHQGSAVKEQVLPGALVDESKPAIGESSDRTLSHRFCCFPASVHTGTVPAAYSVMEHTTLVQNRLRRTLSNHPPSCIGSARKPGQERGRRDDADYKGDQQYAKVDGQVA